jgi:hypothetical protein
VLREIDMRNKIRRIIEMTSDIDIHGHAWGMDTDCGDIENLIDEAEKILFELAKESPTGTFTIDSKAVNIYD